MQLNNHKINNKTNNKINKITKVSNQDNLMEFKVIIEYRLIITIMLIITKMAIIVISMNKINYKLPK